MQQLALPLRFPIVKSFASFIPGHDGEALASVRDWAEGSGPNYIFVHGEVGCGKTHLLHAAHLRLTERHQSTGHLCLKQADAIPNACEQLAELDAVVLDSLEAQAGDPAWEQALFALFQRLQERGARLLVAAQRPPAVMNIQLADLQSRLCSGPGFLLQPLDDTRLDQLLDQGAKERGFTLNPAARRYLLSRCPRDPATLLALLDDIDGMSLAQARAPTVPFLSAFLATRC